MERFTGGCLCGDVRIEARGQPSRVGLCHCLDCRKHHGAVFAAYAIFPDAAVTVRGKTRDFAGRFFCPRCGSWSLRAPAMRSKSALVLSTVPASLAPAMSYGPSGANPGCRLSQS